jgi:dolichyl-phosphate-mannose-protein mannosyltransferase
LNYSYWTIVLPAITVLGLLLFFKYYRKVTLPLAGTTEWIQRIVNRPRFTFTFPLHRMERRDALPLAIITVVCAALSFFRLGDMSAPDSFHRFTESGRSITITLDSESDIGKIMYYTGLWTGHYSLELSQDGANWQEQFAADKEQFSMPQPHSDLFKWRYAGINEDNLPTKYIRISSSKAPLELGELALYDRSGQLIDGGRITCQDAPELFDEQELIPEIPSYMNSMYFDEIYHGRTAYEHLNNIYPYENSHPPLGKLIISIGISILGMNPFGWRFMGTLFGVLMLPILYIFLKNMFGKTVIASCGTILFGFDFMHFTQTRIATIDTYAVFFILPSYFFMYRYIAKDPDSPFLKRLLPLMLSGLFFGIGCASKWVVVYAGIGLAVLYIIHLILTGRYYLENEMQGYCRFLIKTLLFSVLFFAIIPAIIYCLSYIPYGLSQGMTLGGGMLWDPEYYRIIWENQVFMFSYHSKLIATHSYSSWWWQWILDARPILYFSSTAMGGGLKSAFAAFGNPIVWWGGFMAIIAMAYQTVKNRDGKAFFILIGYLSQIVPWLFITRIVFVYHYFPSTLFLAVALAHVLNTIWERAQGRYKHAVFCFTGLAVFLFIMFYPVLSGMAVPQVYTRYILRWIPPMWPF